MLHVRAKENGFLIQHVPFSSLSYVGHASQSLLISLRQDFMFKAFLHLKRMYKKLGRASKTHKITSSRHQRHFYTAAALSKLGRALITKRSVSSPQGFSRLRGGFASLFAFQNQRVVGDAGRPARTGKASFISCTIAPFAHSASVLGHQPASPSHLLVTPPRNGARTLDQN